MTDNAFGGYYSSGGYTAGTVYSDGIGLPTGRAMANGSQACLITALWGYVGARDYNKTVSLRLGSAVTGDFTLTVHPSEGGTGWFNTNNWLVQGGTARFQVNNSNLGTMWIGRGGGGTTTSTNGWSRSGTLGGVYRYVQAPSAPRNLSVSSAAAGQLTTNFQNSADNGGAGVTDFVVEIATNSSFSAGFQRFTTTSGVNTYTGLSPVTYWVRVAARNAVTNAAGTWSVYSSTAVVTLATAPAAPVLTTTAGPRLVHGAWTAPNNGGAPILDYALQVATDTGFTIGLQTFTLSDLSRSVTGLASGTLYHSRARARNSVNSGAWSTTVSTTTPVRTFQDTVGTAAVQVSGGYQLELRSSGAETPVVTLVSSLVTSGVTVTTQATLPVGTGSAQIAAPGTLAGMALVAGPDGSVYVIGRAGNSNSRVIALRYLRTATGTWTLSGINSQAVPDNGNPLNQFAGTWAGGHILVLARRAGLIGPGNLSFATLVPASIASSSGTLFAASGSDPAWLSTPSNAGAANSGLVDLFALTGSRVAIAANGWAVAEVGATGLVTPVTKDANSVLWPGQQLRVVPVSNTVFAILRANNSALAIQFRNTSGALLNSQSIAGTFTDQWDAVYNKRSNLLVVEYMSAARTLSQVQINTSSYTAGAATVLTAVFGAVSTTNTALRLPRGPVDERRVLATAAGVAAGVQSLSSFADISGNVAPASPSLNARAVFDSVTTPVTFTWVFGDPNTLDIQTAFELVIENASTGAAVHTTGKIVSGTSSRLLPAGTITNGVTYRWRVRTYDVLDALSAWSSYSTFPTAAVGSIAITTPATDSPASIVNYVDIVWAYSGSTSSQTHYRIRVLNNATNAVLQDTGMVVGTTTTQRVSNLLSDVVQRIEVSVQNSSGLISTPGTRLVSPTFSVPETPLLLVSTVISYVWVQIINPIPTGSRPEVEVNEVWRREVGETVWVKIAETGANEAYNDYALASDAEYEYFIRARAAAAQADSLTALAISPVLEGVWLFAVDNPIDTLAGFLYGNKTRAESLAVDGTALRMLGRMYPVIEFGIGEVSLVNLSFTIPQDDSHDAAVESLRSLVRRRATLCYRDNRGRLEYGIMSNINITDEKFGSTVSAQFETSNYLEDL